MKYSKYHGLGNDYIVIHPDALSSELDRETVARICRRRYGIGSDGILLGPSVGTACDFGLKIFNSDGSTAEKSGNGLRIFARFLFDRGLVEASRRFTVQTDGGVVTCEVHGDGERVTVDMGKVRFDSRDIPITGPPREVLEETLEIDGQSLTFCGATVGNPHCVVLVESPTPELARRFGPAIEIDSRFPQRTNVQFMRAMDRDNIQIEIWERGSGYTLASGSSSTASAAVAHKLGWCDRNITVHMPGGRLGLQFDAEFAATLTGPVAYVGDGTIGPGLLAPDGG